MTIRARRWTNRLGFVSGIVIAVAIVAVGRVPEGERALGAELTVTAGAGGGLAVTPTAGVLARHGLAPGGPAARGRLSLRNQTSRPVSVLVRASGPERALDRKLRLELNGAHGAAFRASLRRLRRWRPLGHALASQMRERLTVRVWIPDSVHGGDEGRRAQVALEFLRKGARS